MTRYSLSGAEGAEGAEGALAELHAEEVVALGHDQLGLKARSWVTLRAVDAAPPPAPHAHVELAAALQELPDALQPADSLLVPVPREHSSDYEVNHSLHL